MRRAIRFFKPSVTVGALLIILGGLLLMAYGVLKAHARMAVETELRAACARELRELERATPFVVTYFKPENPCAALRVVRGGR